MIANGGYYVVNNDRLVQLSGGRLLLPYAYSMTLEGCIQPRCGCFISDDAGESWRHGDEEIYVQPDNYHIPELIIPDKLVALRNMTYERVCSQEPGVVELTEGRVMMWARSNGGCTYVAYSEDSGQTWSPFKVLCDTPMANGPATIMRVPDTSRLVMLHNDRTGVPYGDDTFQWRTPLAVSVSDDDGASWNLHEPLICDDTHNYCYYSMCFFADKCLVTTYESVNNIDDNGKEVRRNLRSLRTLIVDNAWWMG